jgi:hypothetical protein
VEPANIASEIADLRGMLREAPTGEESGARLGKDPEVQINGTSDAASDTPNDTSNELSDYTETETDVDPDEDGSPDVDPDGNGSHAHDDADNARSVLEEDVADNTRSVLEDDDDTRSVLEEDDDDTDGEDIVIYRIQDDQPAIPDNATDRLDGENEGSQKNAALKRCSNVRGSGTEAGCDGYMRPCDFDTPLGSHPMGRPTPELTYTI